jgi:hypothetical protein
LCARCRSCLRRASVCLAVTCDAGHRAEPDNLAGAAGILAACTHHNLVVPLSRASPCAVTSHRHRVPQRMGARALSEPLHPRLSLLAAVLVVSPRGFFSHVCCRRAAAVAEPPASSTCRQAMPPPSGLFGHRRTHARTHDCTRAHALTHETSPVLATQVVLLKFLYSARRVGATPLHHRGKFSSHGPSFPYPRGALGAALACSVMCHESSALPHRWRVCFKPPFLWGIPSNTCVPAQNPVGFFFPHAGPHVASAAAD